MTTTKTIETEMLPSERKQLLAQIAQLRQEKDAAYATALRKVNRVVLMMDDLSVDQKTAILELIWDK